MQKRKFSLGFNSLITALILIGLLIYLSHKKDRDLIALNESKSKLTNSNQTPVPIRESGPSNLLTVDRSYTETELNKMSEEQFSKLILETQKKLPTLSNLKAIPKEALHQTPPEVLEAGRDLGVIKEILNIHQNYEKLATPFYQACAENKEGITPVRALCLTNLIVIKKKNGERFNLENFPKEIIDLTKMVTDI